MAMIIIIMKHIVLRAILYFFKNAEIVCIELIHIRTSPPS